MTDSQSHAHHVAVVVAVFGLESAETVVAGSGGGRRVTATTTPEGDALVVFEMSVPEGVGPLSVQYPPRLVLPGQPEPPGYSVEVYDWRTRTWRSLPPVGRPQTAYVVTPLDDAEVNDGLVRVRHRSDSDAGPSVIGYSQLILTSDSEDPPAPG